MADLLTPPAKPVRLTSSDIRLGMSKRWTEPEYAIMWEVSNVTGASAKRYADAVIMSLWPSRGLELHGVEIKVSRSDWKREAADPKKAEAIARYCDRWYIHTTPGVVDDLSDLPPAWGLREYDGKSWKTIREAAKNDPEPITRPFLAALLRRADDMMRLMVNEATRQARDTAHQEIEKFRESRSRDIEEAAKRRTAHLEKKAESIAEFEAAFGADSLASWGIHHAALGRAARVLSECGSHGYTPLATRLRTAADAIDDIARMVDAPATKGADHG
ncbi:hypothetical protein AKG11_03455 [Shinella sp. SUS2]|uniref:hypothetical protein n=1 Tax=unclassified Shinella TaxID=2643062 RepID=UPI000680CA24|nr:MULTISPECIES: hypothetical protein [unclassified Shinella]KNY18210.1 hypothetical protein AKG11_03455 [Shinella sp. SUS2]KOC77405.1 hypothetical protein AKG10_00925 [Shinella sp. GWS1]